MHFGKKIIKQKLQGAPDLVGAGHLFGPQIRIRKDLGPMSFWSHGDSLWRGVHKIKVALYVPNSYLVRLDTLYLDPWVQGAQKWAQWGFWSLSSVFWRTHYKTKIAGHPQLSGGRSPFLPQIRIWKDLGPVCFWSRGPSLSSIVYNIKVEVFVPYRYPPNNAWPQGQGIGLEVPTGPWKVNVWLSQHTLVIILNLTTNYFLKPHLNHPRQHQVTQAGH